jgi:hypothetical protein
MIIFRDKIYMRIRLKTGKVIRRLVVNDKVTIRCVKYNLPDDFHPTRTYDIGDLKYDYLVD